MAGRDGLWLRHGADGQVHGSIAIDGTRAAGRGAHLRGFLVADALRGKGHGKALLRQALAFADATGAAGTEPWNFAGLDAARHLYETHDFRLAEQAPGTQWGATVLEQCLVRDRP